MNILRSKIDSMQTSDIVAGMQNDSICCGV